MPTVEHQARTTIDELLARARRRLRRLDPHQALDALADGAALIDIRSDGQRGSDGLIPGAHVVARNVPFRRATDVARGFQAWRAAGLSVEPGRDG